MKNDYSVPILHSSEIAVEGGMAVTAATGTAEGFTEES